MTEFLRVLEAHKSILKADVLKAGHHGSYTSSSNEFLDAIIRAALHYALTRRGPLSLSVNQCGGYFSSSPDMAHPDQQLYFNPVTYSTAPHGKRSVVQPDPFAGFIISFQPSRPTSRGRIDISGRDPEAAPLIRPNSLGTEEDRAQVIAGAQLC